jgi:hypothetical protein
MGNGRYSGILDLSSFTDLELKVDGLAQAMEELRADRIANDEEADAFADCIEDLWIRIVTLRREYLRGGMGAGRWEERMRMVLSVIRMLEGDLLFARERGQY